jgi:hypothetical protein
MSQRPKIKKYRRFGQRLQAMKDALEKGDVEKAVAIYFDDPHSRQKPLSKAKWKPYLRG